MYNMGVDQSYKSCAIVILKGGELIEAKIFSSDGEEDIFKRARQIAADIMEVVNKYHPNIEVGIEGLAFGMRGDATRDLAGLLFTIVNQLQEIVDPVIISPRSVKKIAGDGSSAKQDMVDNLPPVIRTHFMEVMGRKKSTGLYDLTDAYWIAVASQDPDNGQKASDFIKKARNRKKKSK